MIRHIVTTEHALVPLGDAGQLNALWRILFARTLAPEQRALVLSQRYLATDLSVSAIIDRCAHLPWPMRTYLDAKGFDAVLFCMPRPVRLPRGVRQIMRFHDSVPVTDVDTVVNWKMAMAHSRLVRACDPDAIFVCNSPQSRQDLISLDPTREVSRGGDPVRAGAGASGTRWREYGNRYPAPRHISRLAGWGRSERGGQRPHAAGLGASGGGRALRAGGVHAGAAQEFHQPGARLGTRGRAARPGPEAGDRWWHGLARGDGAAPHGAARGERARSIICTMCRPRICRP